MRIKGGGVSTNNPFGPNWGTKGAEKTSSVGQQVQDNLFGKPKPKVLDQDDMEVSRQMGLLHTYRKRIARIAGDDEDDYSLLLSAGTIAMIDQQGVIYVGKQFLLNHSGNTDLLVGVLAHEIGHRPKRWSQYRDQRPLNKEEMNQLCRTEETRADYFAGVALAELGLQPAAVCGFLKAVQIHPHPEYFSADLRVQVIAEGFESGRSKSETRKKFFPEFARFHGAKGDLGSG